MRQAVKNYTSKHSTRKNSLLLSSPCQVTCIYRNWTFATEVCVSFINISAVFSRPVKRQLRKCPWLEKYSYLLKSWISVFLVSRHLKVAVYRLLWILMSDFLLSAARDRATLAAWNSLWCIIEYVSMYNAAWNVAQHSTPRNNRHRTDTHFSHQKSLLANRAAKVTSWNSTLINHF